MAQDSLSSTTQWVGNPGLLGMVCLDNTGAGANVTVEFSPVYARIVTPAFSPFQHVNQSIEGGLHVFQYSSNEALKWVIQFHDLPYFNAQADVREETMGYQDLLSFFRFTVNYHASTIAVYSPDGFNEPSMRYMGGLSDTFGEADAGQGNVAQRAQRWAGQITLMRTLPWTY